jgi:hypothetical protein
MTIQKKSSFFSLVSLFPLLICLGVGCRKPTPVKSVPAAIPAAEPIAQEISKEAKKEPKQEKPTQPVQSVPVEDVGSYAPSKKIKTMTLDELTKARAYYVKYDKQVQLADTLERLIALSPDHEIIQPYLREFAELQFKRDIFAESEVLYQRYTQLYPGSPDVAYMMFQGLLSVYKQLRPASHDLTKVKTLLEQSKDFLKRFGETHQYSEQVQQLIRTAQVMLLEGEYLRALSSLKKDAYAHRISDLQAAMRRLTYIETKVLSQLPEAPEVLDSELKRLLGELKTEKYTALSPDDAATREVLVGVLSETFEVLAQLCEHYRSSLKYPVPSEGWF